MSAVFSPELAPLITSALLAVSIFVGAIAFSWPWIAPNPMSKRLRESVDGKSRGKSSKRRGDNNSQTNGEPQPAGLRTKPSELLNKLIATLRVSERLNDGEMVNLLQQAGFRGRPAAVKYLAFRILSPFVFLGFGLLFAGVIAPSHVPFWQKGLMVLASVVFGYYLPSILLKNRIEKRKVEIGRVWPDAVDLMLICVETGMSIEHAFKKVAEETAGASIELAKEMSLTTAELSYLQERRQAYENMSKRIDLDAVKSVMGCLIQSEKYGTSLGISLRVLAQESREMRMAAAEKKAAALPPKLTVPMIIFFLPVLFAVIITPAALQISGN